MLIFIETINNPLDYMDYRWTIYFKKDSNTNIKDNNSSCLRLISDIISEN